VQATGDGGEDGVVDRRALPVTVERSFGPRGRPAAGAPWWCDVLYQVVNRYELA
jgi:hypothetical protein